MDKAEVKEQFKKDGMRRKDAALCDQSGQTKLMPLPHS